MKRKLGANISRNGTKREQTEAYIKEEEEGPLHKTRKSPFLYYTTQKKGTQKGRVGCPTVPL